jgi:creatinine amidohydrolase/Fe(II)-dependent formamide hydrolase-like protein
MGEQNMEQQSVGQTVADLTEAVAIQAEIAHDRLALEWGHIVVTRLLKVWKQLETHDAMAYEDKVAAQAHILDEATSSLWHLHKALVRTNRTLKAHQQQLKRIKPPVSAA